MAAAGISPARWCCQSGLDFSRETTSQTREWGDISHPHGNGAAYGALQRRCCEIFSISVSMPSLPSPEHMGRRADGVYQGASSSSWMPSRLLPFPRPPAPLQFCRPFLAHTRRAERARHGMPHEFSSSSPSCRRPFTRALPWAAAALCKDNGPELTGLHER